MKITNVWNHHLDNYRIPQPGWILKEHPWRLTAGIFSAMMGLGSDDGFLFLSGARILRFQPLIFRVYLPTAWGVDMVGTFLDSREHLPDWKFRCLHLVFPRLAEQTKWDFLSFQDNSLGKVLQYSKSYMLLIIHTFTAHSPLVRGWTRQHFTLVFHIYHTWVLAEVWDQVVAYTYQLGTSRFRVPIRSHTR